MSETFASIESSEGNSLSLLTRVCDEIERRLKAIGVDLYIDEDRELERRFLSEPERIVRTLSSFFCCCSGAGTLYEYLEWGLKLLPEIEEIGAKGCARAFRDLVPFRQRHEALHELLEAGTICDEEYDRRWAVLLQEREVLESVAEGDFVWADLLWRYASEHRTEILHDGKA